MKISGVYKITNTVTGKFYIGSSKDVKKRLAVHKCQSTWKNNPNKQLYKDIQNYKTYFAYFFRLHIRSWNEEGSKPQP